MVFERRLSRICSQSTSAFYNLSDSTECVCGEKTGCTRNLHAKSGGINEGGGGRRRKKVTQLDTFSAPETAWENLWKFDFQYVVCIRRPN